MDKLYNEYYSKLFNFINYRVQNKEDAKDILSEVFIKIHKNIDKLDSKDKLTSWIYTITRNTIIDFYRKQKQTPVLQEFEEEKITLEENKNIYDELSSCIEPIINTLPSKYKNVLLLSELKGLKQKDISTLKNLSLSNTKNIIHRGKKMVKEKLFECCSYEYDSLGNVIDFTKKSKLC